MSYIDGVKPGESHLVQYTEVGHDLSIATSVSLKQCLDPNILSMVM